MLGSIILLHHIFYRLRLRAARANPAGINARRKLGVCQVSLRSVERYHGAALPAFGSVRTNQEMHVLPRYVHPFDEFARCWPKPLVWYKLEHEAVVIQPILSMRLNRSRRSMVRIYPIHPSQFGRQLRVWPVNHLVSLLVH